MTKYSTTMISKTQSGATPSRKPAGGRRHNLWKLTPLALMLALLAGCQSSTSYRPVGATEQPGNRAEAITLREGDVLRVSFPGSPNLDTQPQPIRRDGNLTLPLVGEVKAAGLTPAELEKELVKRYSTHLVSKEVSVTVVSSVYAVYVSGAVLRPGKVTSDHPISALEAIMEAGGFDNTRANLKEVTVTRQEGGQPKTFTLNLKDALKGKSAPFYLKPSDIVYVPEKFAWF